LKGEILSGNRLDLEDESGKIFFFELLGIIPIFNRYKKGRKRVSNLFNR
jgi:hypothetical protein